MDIPATTTRGGPKTVWTRDTIIKALRRYAELYGDDFTTAAFSPSTAKWRDRGDELIDRYYAGDPDTGEPWPALNSIKKAFGESFNEARIAAGLSPNKPGPGKGRRPSGLHAPVRDVSHAHATRVVYREKAADPDEIRRLRDEVRKLRKRVAELKDRPASTKTITKTKRVIERVTDSRALDVEVRKLDRLAQRLDETEDALGLARSEKARLEAELREARTTATRAVSARERAEAKSKETISELRSERRSLRSERDRALDRAVAAERQPPVVETERVIVHKDAPEQALIDEAREQAAQAHARARDAELRAARREREYLEIAAAVKGERRKLSKDEIAELAKRGPAGPAMLTAALRKFGAIRSAGGNRNAMYAALTEIASAAVSWRERL